MNLSMIVQKQNIFIDWSTIYLNLLS
ncbi:BH3334 [Halalkalibacterium halodurans C-125]|uniref:BH3334 protein n=1 Tax=Halalkalibacterium halodurans (strain ATCC BAA-125 / DSM 18197 / FERM 7344 / JCM 9153 / C-125) TaxID=272558 RepID=Q9K7M7_HALH5|nr:BH3334 [Halalkalibacterium halodurans C-125]